MHIFIMRQVFQCEEEKQTGGLGTNQHSYRPSVSVYHFVKSHIFTYTFQVYIFICHAYNSNINLGHVFLGKVVILVQFETINIDILF